MKQQILIVFGLVFLAACGGRIGLDGPIGDSSQAVAPLTIQAWCQDQIAPPGGIQGPECLTITNVGAAPAEYVLGNFAEPRLQSWILHQIGAGQYSQINTLENAFQPGVCIRAPTNWATDVSTVACTDPTASISVNRCGWQICSVDCSICIGTPASPTTHTMSWERPSDPAFDFAFRGFGYRTVYQTAAVDPISNLPLYARTYFLGRSTHLVASDSSATLLSGIYQPISGNSELFYQFPLVNGGVAISSMQFGGSYSAPPTTMLAHDSSANISFTSAMPTACGAYDSQTWLPSQDTGGFRQIGVADACKPGYALTETSSNNLIPIVDSNSPSAPQWAQLSPMYQ